jgi:hypothetical protein
MMIEGRSLVFDCAGNAACWVAVLAFDAVVSAATGLTGIDGAARRKQVDVAGRNTGHANERGNAGAGLRRGGRLGHVAVSVVENLRGAGDDRRLLALSGVDVAIGRPDHDVAAKLGEDTGLGDDDALIAEDVDIAALQGEQARPRRIGLAGQVWRLVDETEPSDSLTHDPEITEIERDQEKIPNCF